jgi:hypothetical protein
VTSEYIIPHHRHRRWLTDLRRSLLLASGIFSFALGIGTLGYHHWGHLVWIDALLEASMILGGMGPVAPMQNESVKLFASFYALFSGILLLTTMGMLLAPWLQRLLYHTHRQAHHDAAGQHNHP